VAVTPGTATVVTGGSTTLTAELRDASGNVLTGRSITWASDAIAVATVSSTGVVSALSAGTARITATSEGRSGQATITVTPPPPAPVASVAVKPDTASVIAGATTTLTAELRDASGAVLTGRAVTWASDATAVATVSSTGVVSAVSVGTARITATSEGRSGQATITVTPPPVASVTIAPDSLDVVLRATTQLAATARDAGGAVLGGRTVNWTSANPAVATVSGSGLVTALTQGTTTITASSEGRSGTARVRVVQADLASIVDSVRQAFNLPALGAAIVTRPNGVTAIGVAGTRRFGRTLPVTLNDKWHIGSNSKRFTALLAGLAVKEGRLSWNDLLLTRYPELNPLARAEFRTTTLLDLVGMRAGIVGNPLTVPTGTDAQMRATVDRWAIQQPPAAAPGSYYYSNIAYQMLGEVAARAWGQTFTQAMQDRVFAPMGITSAGFGPTTGAGGDDQPVGHSPSGAGWTVCEACDNAWALGSGKIHMSLPDFARFAHEELRAHVGQSTLLTQTEARALTNSLVNSSANLGYGYGWEVFRNQPQRIVKHDGTNGRNRSRALIYLDSGLALLVVTNAGDLGNPTGGAPAAAFDALVTRLLTFHQTGR
jgi:CubicO group peptidase (beta-lactamase class C family)